MKDRENTFVVVLVITSALAMSMAVGIVLGIFGYMDHMYGNASLKFGGSDIQCLHDACTQGSP